MLGCRRKVTCFERSVTARFLDSQLHEEYLKEMAVHGILSRRSGKPVRTESKNHGSVHGYEEELLSKAWKDAAYGAMLLIDPERDGIVQILQDAGVAESPLGRVPKQNPDRTVSAQKRPINDMRTQNAKGSKYNHPPAPQPRHQAVARQSLWWHSRHPGIPQRCAKRDVPRAFNWHFLRTSDVAEFAVRLAGIIMVSLVMPFGWVGAPGEFVAWSMAAQSTLLVRSSRSCLERHRSLRVEMAHGRWGCPGTDGWQSSLSLVPMP